MSRTINVQLVVSILQSNSDYCDWWIICFLISSLFIRSFWESMQFEGKMDISIIQVRCLILNMIWFIILVIITEVNVLGGKWLLEWDGGWGFRVSLLVHGYDFQEGKVHIRLECMLFILSHIQWKQLNKFCVIRAAWRKELMSLQNLYLFPGLDTVCS